jgi:phospholipase C
VNLDQAPAADQLAVHDAAVHPAEPADRAPHPAHAHKDKPLSPPARGLLGLLLAKYGTPDDDEPETYADAYELLHRYGVGLFGKPRS